MNFPKILARGNGEDGKRQGTAVLIALVVTLLLVLLVGKPMKISEEIPSASEFSVAWGMPSGDVVEQELEANDSILTDFSVIFATYTCVKEGTLRVELYENENLIQVWEQNSNVLIDNAPKLFSLDTPLLLNSGNSYRVAITDIYEGDNAVAIWMTGNNKEGNCYSNGNLLDLDMAMARTYKNDKLILSNGFVLYVVLVLVAGLFCSVLYRFIAEEKVYAFKKVANVFFETKLVGVISVLLLSKLTQTVFFPHNMHGTSAIKYFASFFAIGAHLTLVVFSYVTGCSKFNKAYTTAMIVCTAGYCVGKLVDSWGVVYNGVYYLTILMNLYVFLRVAYGFTVKKGVLTLKKFVFGNWKQIVACVFAAVIGACIELFRAIYRDGAISWIKVFFWILTCLCLTLCVILYRKKESFIERAALCVLLTTGIGMAVLLPFTTGVTWDDHIHYQNALLLVQGPNWTAADWSMSARELGIWEPTSSISQLLAYFNDLSERAKQVFAGKYLLEADVQPLQCLGYIPHCIGIWVGQILKLPYSYTYIMGRIGSAVIYSLVMYAAMKRLAGGKLLLAVIALLPTNLFQACNYTYDSWIVCMVAYAVAVFVSCLQDKEKLLEIKEYWAILVVMALAIAPKGVYFPLYLLFLFMPSSKFVDKKQHHRYILAVLGAAFVCFAAYMVLPFMGGAYGGDDRFGTEVSSKGQVFYILNHPAAYAKVLLNFLKDYLSPENSHGYTSFLANVGGKDFHTTLYMVIVVAALVDRCDKDRNFNSILYKVIGFGTPIIAAAVIASVLYISCVPVGASEIGHCCQPRYLSPLLFPLFIFCCNFGCFKAKNREGLCALILSVSGYICYASIWVSVIGRYVP